MSVSRLLPAFAVAALLIAPALGQTSANLAAKPPTLAARVEALEKENQSLRDDVNRLQSLLTQTRRDMIIMEGGAIRGGGGYVAAAPSLLQPQSLASQQAQTQAQINQMNTQTQLNSLQLQQSMARDRLREQQVLPPPFGTATP